MVVRRGDNPSSQGDLGRVNGPTSARAPLAGGTSSALLPPPLAMLGSPPGPQTLPSSTGRGLSPSPHPILSEHPGAVDRKDLRAGGIQEGEGPLTYITYNSHSSPKK